MLLIVNVASKCGPDAAVRVTGESAENLVINRASAFLVSIASGPGAGQRRGNKNVLQYHLGRNFPDVQQIDVNGEGRHPLYQKLIDAAPTAVAPADSGFYERMASKGRAPLYPDDIRNFEKFLRVAMEKCCNDSQPDMTPEDPILVQTIKQALAN